MKRLFLILLACMGNYAIAAMDSTSIYWFGNSLLGSGGVSRITEFTKWKTDKMYPLYNNLTNAKPDYSTEIKQSWDSTHNKDSIALGPTKDGKSQWNFVYIQSLYRPNIDTNEYITYMKKYVDLTVASGAVPVIYDDWWARKSDPFETALVLKACKTTGAYMSPVRSAFLWTLTNYPLVHLLASDNIHAKPALGLLAGSCTWATLFAERPFGFDQVYHKVTDELSSDEAHLLQQVAWNFVTLTPYREAQPWSGKTVRLVKNIAHIKKSDTLVQFQTRQLYIKTTFDNDSVDAASSWAIFTSLDPTIAQVSYSGLVTGNSMGLARIVAMREWKVDTLNLWIRSTSLTLDSIRIVPHTLTGIIGNGYHFTAAAFLRDKTVPVKLDITQDAEWSSGDTTIFVVKAGVIQRTSGKGGVQKCLLSYGGMKDSVQFTMGLELKYLNRVKFMDKDTNLNINWNTDTGHVYNASRGHGWLDTLDVAAYQRVADWDAIRVKDSNFLRCGFVRPMKKVSGNTVDAWGTYKFNVPDGDYIIKAVLGHHNPAAVYPCSLLYVNVTTYDTLATFQSQASSKLGVFKDSVKVFGEDGLKIRVFGPIQYLVVCSNEGVDIDSVALDGDAFIHAGAVEDGDSVVVSKDDVSAIPNPFNPSTTLRFSLTQASSTSLRIYDGSGRLVRTVMNGPLGKGQHRVEWNGKDDRGHAVATGIYMVRLNSGLKQSVARLLLAR